MGLNTSLRVATAAALGFAALIAAPAEAQRKQPAPADLEATFEPLETRIEEVRGGTKITFGNRSLTIPGDGAAPQPGNIRMQGSLLMYSDVTRRQGWYSEDADFFRRMYPDYRRHILPGFGMVFTSSPSDNPRDRERVHLLRARDGVVNPPVPGAGIAGESSTNRVFFSPGEPTGLIASRTLFITGSPRLYQQAGTRAAGTFHVVPLEKTVSLAWLFDENGLVQAWTPLADLSGNVGATWPTRLEYVRQSAEGHVMFATPGAGGTLDVHLFEPGLEQMQTFEGVVRLYQQTERPTSNHLTVDVGGTPFENWAMRPGDHKTVLLMPASREGWYSVLREDGIASLPEGVTGLKPLIRNRLGDSEPKGVAPARYDMAYGFLVHYQTPEGERYGWASPELSTYTGPVWTEVQIVDSARLESEARGFVDPRLIVAKTDAGYWRAYAEPRIEYGESTLKEPNTFSGLLPPASTAETAARLAEAALVHFRSEFYRVKSSRTWRALDLMREDRERARQDRMLKMAEREQAWRAAFEGLAMGLNQIDVGTYSPRTRPSALGPDFYWDGDDLIHRPSGRKVD